MGEISTAYFAGGCFWCITRAFAEMGALKVISGYSGGDELAPVYADVKAQKTHHRETVAVQYDTAKLTYADLMKVYIDNTDPFDDGGQFIDRGFSYTLAIYWQNEAELEIARSEISKLEASAGKPCAIALERFKWFAKAEDYHQNYYLTHPQEFEEEMRLSGRIKE